VIFHKEKKRSYCKPSLLRKNKIPFYLPCEMKLWSWLKRKLYKTEVLKVNQCVKSSQSINLGSYQYGYGLLNTGNYGYGMVYKHNTQKIKIDYLNMTCTTQNNTIKQLQVEDWPSFHNYIQQELKLGSSPTINVQSFIGMPVVIRYANNKYYFCNATGLTILVVFSVVAIGLLIGMFC